MKLFISIFIVVLFSSISFAETDIEKCKSISEIAGKIMKLRQHGVPVVQIIEAVDPATHNLVYAVYDTPQFSSQEYKQKAINDIKNEVFVSCMRD